MAASIGLRNCRLEIREFMQTIGIQEISNTDSDDLEETIPRNEYVLKAADKLINFLKDLKSSIETKKKDPLATEQDIEIDVCDETSVETDKQVRDNDVEMKENHRSEQNETEESPSGHISKKDTNAPENSSKTETLEDEGEKMIPPGQKEESNSEGERGNTEEGSTTLNEEACEEIQKKQRDMNANLVQIKASNSEIARRISAFIEQKQTEKDEINKREFYSPSMAEPDSSDSCARVGSVFVTRVGGKSHIKVTRVVNIQGPQTLIPGNNAGLVNIKKEPETGTDLSDGIEERLQNIESHLKVKSYTPEMKNDVFARLKKLEERILYLESLSPEYFSRGIPGPPKAKRQKTKKSANQDFVQEQDMSVSEIDQKIKQLRNSLRIQAEAF